MCAQAAVRLLKDSPTNSRVCGVYLEILPVLLLSVFLPMMSLVLGRDTLVNKPVDLFSYLRASFRFTGRKSYFEKGKKSNLPVEWLNPKWEFIPCCIRPQPPHVFSFNPTLP